MVVVTVKGNALCYTLWMVFDVIYNCSCRERRHWFGSYLFHTSTRNMLIIFYNTTFQSHLNCHNPMSFKKYHAHIFTIFNLAGTFFVCKKSFLQKNKEHH